ncbi:MAG: 5-(carboxyamino)imidazole ribonucleotide synthase [Gammaproteobacteria bacterium]|nr:5-(carboxyamino)imidazole ribonucleotide synthase [Gammaproteobacteria bacterium]
MLAHAAARLGLETVVLDPQPDCPARQFASSTRVGSLQDADAIQALAADCDLLTIEIEDVDSAALQSLSDAGMPVFPPPATVATVQNKLLQKQRLQAAGLPTAAFVALPHPEPRAVLEFGLPCVQKLQRGGYDGRGVSVLRERADLDTLLPGPGLLERLVAFEKELAVLVARDRNGRCCTYPVVELVADARTNMLDLLLAPAPIAPEIAERAQALAVRCADAFETVGVFAIELFLDRHGELSVNEVSPRVHNSGHYTLEACATSQFEQHIRAICGLPLGQTGQWRPAAMMNLVGADGWHGQTVIEGLDEALDLANASLHLYGKRSCRAARKMGHVTVLDERLDQAARRATEFRDRLTIRGSVPD